MKIRPVGAELSHAEGRTHRKNEIWRSYSRFSQFSESAHKNNSDDTKFKASTPTTNQAVAATVWKA